MKEFESKRNENQAFIFNYQEVKMLYEEAKVE
jgi:hypothetical protein